MKKDTNLYLLTMFSEPHSDTEFDKDEDTGLNMWSWSHGKVKNHGVSERKAAFVWMNFKLILHVAQETSLSHNISLIVTGLKKNTGHDG